MRASVGSLGDIRYLLLGGFGGRSFYFSVPSLRIRALQASFTMMRGVNDKVRFSGVLHAEGAQLWKVADDE